MDQTEQTQAKPRRRRRWLIVTLLLVLASGVAWWNWPRGDARFVGTWQVIRDGSRSLSTVTFRANGLGTIDFVTNRKLHFLWRSEPGKIVMGGTPAIGDSRFWRKLYGSYAKATGDLWVGPLTTITIEKADHDELMVSSSGGVGLRGNRLTRIPE